MHSALTTPQEYFDSLPADRKQAMNEIRKVILANLPEGFSEVMAYGMPGYVISHAVYPDGYHCNPKQSLPFISIASQKNFIVLHHLGLYTDNEMLEWFVNEYPKHSKQKPDMGKGCIRFRKIDQIPYTLIGELATKMTPRQWIAIYEKQLKK